MPSLTQGELEDNNAYNPVDTLFASASRVGLISPPSGTQRESMCLFRGLRESEHSESPEANTRYRNRL